MTRLLLLVGLCLLAGPGHAAPANGPPTPPNIQLPEDWHSQFIEEPILGASLHVVTVGDKRNPPLVLLHGLGKNGLMDWQAVIKALKDQYFILALDFPGFAHSSLPPGRLSPENFAAIVHWLVQKHNLDSIHLAGHSMGGAVALSYAARYPQTLHQLTLIDVAGVLHRAAFVKSLINIDLDNRWFIPDSLERKAAELLSFGTSLIGKINFLPDIIQPLSHSNLAWNALLGGLPNTNAALSLINTDYSYIIDAVNDPTIIIWGEQDSIAPLRTGFVLDGLIANSELHIIPSAEHMPLKTHTAAVVSLMLSFPVQNTEEKTQAFAPPTTLTCKGEVGKHYSGRYSHITLQGCMDIELTDIQAESIELYNSTADFLRLRIVGDQTALQLQDSAVRLTDAYLQAPIAIAMDNSRLDMAGTRLHASKAALRVGAESVIIASVSESHSPYYQGKLHGATRIADIAGKTIGETLATLQSDAQPLTPQKH